MASSVKTILRKTPFYSPLLKCFNYVQVLNWRLKGKPLPPPHFIKQKTILDFARRYNANVFVETGTLYGDMIEAMRTHFDKLYSIELSKEFHKNAVERFKNYPHIEIVNGDSSTEIKTVLKKINNETILFWLDSHYSGGNTAKGEKDTPIIEELGHIFNSSKLKHVIIIDDARLFGTDPAYPSIEELRKYVFSKDKNLNFMVKDDTIRISAVI
jgi:hypothetical protein